MTATTQDQNQKNQNTDANNSVVVAPGVGTTSVQAGQTLQMQNFDMADASFATEGDALIITIAGQDPIVIEGFVPAAMGGTGLTIELPNGVELIGSALLQQLVSAPAAIEPAAGDAAPGAGGDNGGFTPGQGPIDEYSADGPIAEVIGAFGFGGANGRAFEQDQLLDPTNVAPDVISPIAFEMDEDGGLMSLGLSAPADRNPGDTVTIEITSLPDSSEGVVTLNGTAITVGQLLTAAEFELLAFQPSLNWNGLTTIVYTATDGKIVVPVEGTIEITVNPINDRPFGDDVTANGLEDDSSISGSFIGDDVDIATNGQTISFEIVSGINTSYQSSNQQQSNDTGTVVNNGDGTFSYVPGALFQTLAEGETTTVSFDYVVNDDSGEAADGSATSSQSEVYTVTITITGQNDAPTADNFQITTHEDDFFFGERLNFQGNDIDNGASLRYEVIDQPNEGAVYFDPIFTNSWRFNPGLDFQDLDSGESRQVTFTYKAIDEHGAESDPATVTVTVTGRNDRPWGRGARLTTNEDTDVNGQLYGNDVDTNDKPNLTYRIVNQPNRGEVTLDPNTGEFTYSPDGDFEFLNVGQSRNVWFSYRVSDGDLESGKNWVRVRVTGVNDAPTADDITGTTDENGVLTFSRSFMNGKIDDVDNTDNSQTLSIVDAPAKGSASFNAAGVLTFNPGTDFDYLADGEQTTVTFTYKTTDPHGADSNTATVTLTITGSNDKPVIDLQASDMSGSIREPGDLVSVQEDDIDGNLETVATITPTAQAAMDSLGTDPSTVEAVLQTLQTELSVNEAEAIAVLWDHLDDNYVVYNNPIVNEAFIRLGVEYAEYLANGGTPLLDVIAKFTPDGADAGTDADRMQSMHDNLLGNLNDGALSSRFSGAKYDELKALIESVNPELLNRPIYSGNEGAVNDSYAFDIANSILPSATGTITATDADHNATWTFSGNATGTYGSFSIDANTGKWTYNLDHSDAALNALREGETKQEVFTVTVTDDKGATDTADVTITVTGTNDAPVANDDYRNDSIITENIYSVTSNVLGNDTDVDNTQAELTVTKAEVIQGHGTAQVAGTDSVQFNLTPGAYEYLADGETADVQVKYTVEDPSGASDTAIVTYVIRGTNDQPVITTAPTTTDATEESIKTGATGMLTASDLDTTDVVSFEVTEQAMLNGVAVGTVTIAPNGQYTFNPNAAYLAVVDAMKPTDVADITFKYVAKDDSGTANDTSAEATHTIQVTGVNDAPTATNFNWSGFNEDTTSLTLPKSHFDQFYIDDVDNTDAELTLSVVTAPAKGFASFDANGNFTFSPNGDFENLALGESDSVTVTYKVTDPHGAEDVKTITIYVTGRNDAPSVTTAPATTDATEESIKTGATGMLTATDVDTTDVVSFEVTEQAMLNGVAVGTVSIAPNGQYTFNPNAAYLAVVDAMPAGSSEDITFKYVAKDDSGAANDTSAEATHTIRVTGVNDAPDAQDYTTVFKPSEDTTTLYNSLPVQYKTTDVDNDYADLNLVNLNLIQGNLSQLFISSNGKGLRFQIDNAAYQHLNVGDTAEIKVEYTVSDGDLTDTAVMTVIVSGLNDAPTAADVTKTTDENTDISFDLTDSVDDVDNDNTALTFEVRATSGGTFPANITVDAVTGDVTVNVAGNYDHLSANDSEALVFEYRTTDGTDFSDWKTATVNITGLNNDPVIISGDSSGDEDHVINGQVVATDDETPAVNLVYSVDGPTPTGLTFNSNGTYTFDPRGNYDSLLPGQKADVQFDVKVTDTNGGTNVETITVTVNGVNDAPVHVPVKNINATEDTVKVITFAELVADATDADHTLTDLRPSNFGHNSGDFKSFNVDYTAKTVTIEFHNNFNGTVDFSYRVYDALNATSNSVTANITVAAVNDAPVAQDDTASADVNIAKTIMLFADNGNGVDSDVEGDAFSIATINGIAVTANNQIIGNVKVINMATGEIEFTSATAGNDSFTYTVKDTAGAESNTATVSVNTIDPNVAPVAQDDTASDTYTTQVSTIMLFADNGNGVDSDADGDSFTVETINGVAVTANNQVINVTGGSVKVVNMATGEVEFTSDGSTTGNVQFNYTVQDTAGLSSNAATVSIAVTANAGPDAMDDSLITAPNTVQTINVLTNDTDTDGDAVQFVSHDTLPTGVTYQGNGVFQFDSSTYSGGQRATFTYQISDGKGGTDTATVTVGANSNPVIGGGHHGGCVPYTIYNGGSFSSYIIPMDNVTVSSANQINNLRITVRDGFQNLDEMNFTGILPPNVVMNVINGGLILEFSGLASAAEYQAIVQAIQYRSTGQNSGNRFFEIEVTDEFNAKASINSEFIATESAIVGDSNNNNSSEAGALTGSSLDDYIFGDSGDDELVGDSGDDVLLGGSGEDTISGGLGNDRIEGNSGNDILTGGLGDDCLHGDSGDDEIHGNEGNDILRDGSGADSLFGGDDDDTIYISDSSNLRVWGGNGFDTIIIDDGSDINLSDTVNSDFIYSGVEVIDNRDNSGLNKITLTQADVMRSSTDELHILGDSNDEVNTVNSNFTNQGQVTKTINGESLTFVHFNDGNADLFVQLGMEYNGTTLA